MAARDYYIILGVASDETEQGVRAAFRELAKRHHPDHVGPEGAAPFREVAEAYEVLGDSSRRRQYDESRKRGPARPPAERLVREVSMRRDLVDVRPSREALFQRIQRNFTPRAVPIPDRVDELSVDVAISPEEAGKGALRRRACRGDQPAADDGKRHDVRRAAGGPGRPQLLPARARPRRQGRGAASRIERRIVGQYPFDRAGCDHCGEIDLVNRLTKGCCDNRRP